MPMNPMSRPLRAGGPFVYFAVALLSVAAILCFPVEAPAQAEAAPEAVTTGTSAAFRLDSTQEAAVATALEEIRAATARFRDVQVALDEGYVRDPMNLCVDAATEGYPRQLGAMGIHYFRPDLLGLTKTEPKVAGNGSHTDFLEPSVLVYMPGPDGSLELVAVENLVFEEGWRAAGHREPPSFHGREYWYMVDNPRTDVDEAHNFEPHYELHLWVHRENPMGAFFPFNPELSCRHHTGPTTVEEALRQARQ